MAVCFRVQVEVNLPEEMDSVPPVEYDELAGPGLGTTFVDDLGQRIDFALPALGTNLVADSRGHIEPAGSAVGTDLVADVGESTDLAGYYRKVLVLAAQVAPPFPALLAVLDPVSRFLLEPDYEVDLVSQLSLEPKPPLEFFSQLALQPKHRLPSI